MVLVSRKFHPCLVEGVGRANHCFQIEQADMTESFVVFCLDVLSVVGSVRARGMFGGHGIYLGEVMFALVANDVLYLKVDEETCTAFKEAESEPFIYHGKQGQPVTMSYWKMPLEGFESPEQAKHWAGLAINAAQRAKR